jgi:voltage-gated potassium channel
MRDKRLSQSERKLILSLMALLCVVLAGTAGYIYLEHWSLLDSIYMTVITLTTIGFKEVHELDNAGQVFTIALVIFGVGTVAVAVKNATKLMLEGELRNIFGRKRLEKEIAKLKGHYIVCGYGRMGRFIARELAGKPVPFVIIERNAESIPEADREKYLFYIGEADKDDTLVDAGIDRAKGLITVVSTDAENLYIVLTARGLNPKLSIVARAGEEGSETKLKRAGANRVISPYLIGAHKIAQAVIRPAVLDFLEFATSSENMDLNMEEVSILPGSLMAGKKIKDSGIRQELDIIIVAIKKATGAMNFNPSPGGVLEEGDVLIALGRPDMLRRLEGMAKG